MLLEVFSNLFSIEIIHFFHGPHGAVKVRHDITVDTIANDFRDRAKRISDYRRATGHGLDHDQAKRLRPTDRKQQGRGISQEIIFFRKPYLAYKFNTGTIQQRPDAAVKIFLIGTVY